MFKSPDQIKQYAPDPDRSGLGNQEENENKLFLDAFSEYDKLKRERQNFENTWEKVGKGTNKEREEYHDKIKEIFLKEDNALTKLVEFFYATPTIDVANYYFNDDGTLSTQDIGSFDLDVDDIKVIPEGIFRRVGVQLGDLNISKIDSINCKKIFKRSFENKKFCLEALDIRLKNIEESKEKLSKELKIIEEISKKL